MKEIIMELMQEVRSFASACEHLLAKFAMQRPLSKDEGRLVEYYCQELLQKAASSAVGNAWTMQRLVYN
jgi:hypothetical protein